MTHLSLPKNRLSYKNQLKVAYFAFAAFLLSYSTLVSSQPNPDRTAQQTEAQRLANMVQEDYTNWQGDPLHQEYQRRLALRIAELVRLNPTNPVLRQVGQQLVRDAFFPNANPQRRGAARQVIVQMSRELGEPAANFIRSLQQEIRDRLPRLPSFRRPGTGTP